MDLEFYTIAQASRVLGCEPDEVEHFIESGKLPVFFHAKKNRFIVTDGNGAGLAVVTYTGLVKARKEYVAELYGAGELFIEEEFIIDAKGINEWAQWPPIDADVYLQETGLPINCWKATSQHDMEAQDFYKVILFAHLSPEHLQSEHKKKRDLDLELNGHTDLGQYSYFGCWDYSIPDIRISHADLMAFMIETATASNNARALVQSTAKMSAIDLGKQRGNELHELILQVLVAVPNISTRDVWRELKNDVDRTDKKFDHSEILQSVSKTEIVWVSRYGHVRNQKLVSFPGTVSRLRKLANRAAAQTQICG